MSAWDQKILLLGTHMELLKWVLTFICRQNEPVRSISKTGLVEMLQEKEQSRVSDELVRQNSNLDQASGKSKGLRELLTHQDQQPLGLFRSCQARNDISL